MGSGLLENTRPEQKFESKRERERYGGGGGAGGLDRA